MTSEKKAMLQMLVCAALWSISGILFKWIELNAFAIAGMRSLFAALTVYVYMKRRGEKLILSRQTVIAGFFLAATFFAFVSANKLTTAANAIVLQYTNPVFILIASVVLFREKLRKLDLIIGAVTLGGIALFFLDQLDAGHLAGNLVALLSGIFMAGMYLSVRRCPEKEKMSAMLLGQLLTAAIGTPFLAMGGQLTGKAVGLLAVLGIVQLGIPYILFGLASVHCTPLACSLIGAVEPMLNPLWVAMLDGETPGLFALMGAVVVIVAITSWCILKDRDRGEEKAIG